MSAIDDLVIDAINNGGTDCICRGTTTDQSVQFFSPVRGSNKYVMVLCYNKNCPIHGIKRFIYPHKPRNNH